MTGEGAAEACGAMAAERGCRFSINASGAIVPPGNSDVGAPGASDGARGISGGTPCPNTGGEAGEMPETDGKAPRLRNLA